VGNNRRTLGSSNHSQLLSKGNVLLAEGKLREAMACYEEAVALEPDDAPGRVNLGYTLVESGEPARAVQVLEPATERDPGLLDAWFLLGQALKGCGRLGEAEAALRRALALQPGFPFALRELAAVLAETGRGSQALEALDPVMEAFAQDPAIWYLRGNLEFGAGSFAQAAESYAHAAQLHPGFVEAMSNRAVCLQKLGRREEAIGLFEQALRLQPDYRGALYNLGVTLLDLGRCAQALQVCDAALRFHPQDANIHWNKATAHLLLGQLDEGWPEHEWRWKSNVLGQPIVPPAFKCPVWSGAEPLQGKTVLLYPEQGLGDTIQFLRYAPLVAARGARVLVQLPAALEPLVRDWPTVTLVREGDALPRLDFFCTFLSLPMAFRTTLESIPAQVPYLRSDPALRARWEERLGPRRSPRVGLVWSGNPAHQNDANRSIALAVLLAQAPSGFQWVSLQKEVRESDRAALADLPALLHVGEQLHSFAETAALADCMDLVISVDTSMAHLAGALGKPLWLLLPARPDWRWMLRREDSPWYPGARLFRQDQRRDWGTVLATVWGELRRAALGTS
jgi:tetratricopeptide (TPR) repeat protein